MRPSPCSCRLGLRDYSLSGPPRVHWCYGPATRTPPAEGVVNGLQVIRFPSCLPSSYGASDCYPDGTDPRWTQQPFLDAQPCGTQGADAPAQRVVCPLEGFRKLRGSRTYGLPQVGE